VHNLWPIVSVCLETLETFYKSIVFVIDIINSVALDDLDEWAVRYGWVVAAFSPVGWYGDLFYILHWKLCIFLHFCGICMLNVHIKGFSSSLCHIPMCWNCQWGLYPHFSLGGGLYPDCPLPGSANVAIPLICTHERTWDIVVLLAWCFFVCF